MSSKIRPRITPEEFEVIKQYRGILKASNEAGLNVEEVKHGWLKTKDSSLFFKNPNFKDQAAREQEILKDQLIDFFKSESKKTRKKPKRKGKHILVIDPADVHIGKLCTHFGTGEEYNSKIAIERVFEGVRGILDNCKGFDIEKILFCIGNDVLHIDNVYNQTTAGTGQDVDGKWWEHFEVALALYVKCIEILREIAPVDVVHSMSNHDYQSGFHLAHALKSWFRNDRDITFDISVAHRKYYKYGKNLIGLEHGDGAKMANLPLMMAQEKPTMWSETKYRYWYLHHLHHKVKHKWLDAKDFIGVTVEYMRSPSGTDSWHSRKGYVGVPKAVEGFLHEKTSGQVARLVHYF